MGENGTTDDWPIQWQAADFATQAAADFAKAASTGEPFFPSSSFRESVHTAGNTATTDHAHCGHCCRQCPCSCGQCQCFGGELLPATSCPGPLHARARPDRLVKNCCC